LSASRWATPCSQPASESPARIRAGLAGQGQERRLEDVVGVVAVRQHAAGDAQDHRPVPAQERFEGAIVPPRRQARQEVAIGRLRCGVYPRERPGGVEQQGGPSVHGAGLRRGEGSLLV
jgi:hypothetical protein